MYDMIDLAIADSLEVSVETYIEKIEQTSMHRAEIIIGAVMSGDPEKLEKAKRIFNML